MRRVSVLDENGHLVGDKLVKEGAKVPKGATDVDPGDLPLDGTYKWTGETFMPLGHGFRKPTRAPIPDSYALYLVIRALDTRVAKEARVWADWYEENLRQRAEESSQRARLRKGR